MALIRYLLYFTGLTIVVATLVRLEISYPGFLNFQTFVNATDSLGTSEYSPIEFIQPVILLACGLLMSWVAYFCPTQRTLAIAIGGLSLAFLIRELDYFFDRIVDNLWQALIAIAGALVIVYLYRHLKRLQVAVGRAWPSPGLVLLFAGGVVLFSLVHFIGHEPLWQSILGEHYVRVAKLAVEEFVELIGFLLWLIGTIEYAYQAKAISYQEPQPAARRMRERRRRGKERPF